MQYNGKLAPVTKSVARVVLSGQATVKRTCKQCPTHRCHTHTAGTDTSLSTSA